jgi:hypothetical protein
MPGARRLRYTLLGWAAAGLAAGGVLSLSGDLVSLISNLTNDLDEPNGAIASDGVGLVASSGTLAAFIVAAAAFFGSSARRRERLATAFLVLGAAFGVGFVASVIEAVTDISEDTFGRVVAYDVTSAVGAALLVAAAFMVAAGFRLSGAREVEGRNLRLGWGAALVGGSFALSVAGGITILTLYSDLGATSGLTAGLGIDAGGSLAAVVASALAAVGLFGAALASGQTDAWLARRELWLGIAAGVLIGALLTSSVGSMIAAAAGPDNGFGGADVANAWLTASGLFLTAAAAGCACAAFFNTRRALSGPASA